MSHNNGHILGFSISALVHAGAVAALVVGVASAERAIESAKPKPTEIRVNLASLVPVTQRPVDTSDPTDPASRSGPVGRSPELTPTVSTRAAAQKLSGQPAQIAAVARPPAKLMAAWVGVSHNVVMPEPAYEPDRPLAEQNADQPSTDTTNPSLTQNAALAMSQALTSTGGIKPQGQGDNAPGHGQGNDQNSGKDSSQGKLSGGSAAAQSAQLEKLVHPEYPRVSRERGEEGRVVVRVRVTPDGRVADAKIEKSSGYRRLDSAALKAAKDCRFETASLSKADVEAGQVLAFVFRLDHAS